MSKMLAGLVMHVEGRKEGWTYLILGSIEGECVNRVVDGKIGDVNIHDWL